MDLFFFHNYHITQIYVIVDLSCLAFNFQWTTFSWNHWKSCTVYPKEIVNRTHQHVQEAPWFTWHQNIDEENWTDLIRGGGESNWTEPRSGSASIGRRVGGGDSRPFCAAPLNVWLRRIKGWELIPLPPLFLSFEMESSIYIDLTKF